MVVTDQNRAKVTFGFDRLDWQLDRLGILLDQVEDSKKEIQTVNLMVQRNVPVTFVEPVEESDSADPAPSPTATPAPSRKTSSLSSKDKKPVSKPTPRKLHGGFRKHSDRDEQG